MSRLEALAETAPEEWAGDAGTLEAYLLGALTGIRLAERYPTAARELRDEIESEVASMVRVPAELVEQMARFCAERVADG